MKSLYFTIIAALVSTVSIAQNQIMVFSHSSGITPSSELTVGIDEEIDFFYGGGQSHPMTESWESGEVSSPVPFETVTVTSANTQSANNPVTFSLSQVGTYYFHCGNNSSNSNLWGKINVVDSTSLVSETEEKLYSIYPNPVTDVLTIDGNIDLLIIYNMNGQEVLRSTSSSINVSELSNGMYLLKSSNFETTFIKK
jgi:hypothetical protein